MQSKLNKLDVKIKCTKYLGKIVSIIYITEREQLGNVNIIQINHRTREIIFLTSAYNVVRYRLDKENKYVLKKAKKIKLQFDYGSSSIIIPVSLDQIYIRPEIITDPISLIVYNYAVIKIRDESIYEQFYNLNVFNEPLPLLIDIKNTENMNSSNIIMGYTSETEIKEIENNNTSIHLISNVIVYEIAPCEHLCGAPLFNNNGEWIGIHGNNKYGVFNMKIRKATYLLNNNNNELTSHVNNNENINNKNNQYKNKYNYNNEDNCKDEQIIHSIGDPNNQSNNDNNDNSNNNNDDSNNDNNNDNDDSNNDNNNDNNDNNDGNNDNNNNDSNNDKNDDENDNKNDNNDNNSNINNDSNNDDNNDDKKNDKKDDDNGNNDDDDKKDDKKDDDDGNNEDGNNDDDDKKDDKKSHKQNDNNDKLKTRNDENNKPQKLSELLLTTCSNDSIRPSKPSRSIQNFELHRSSSTQSKYLKTHKTMVLYGNPLAMPNNSLEKTHEAVPDLNFDDEIELIKNCCGQDLTKQENIKEQFLVKPFTTENLINCIQDNVFLYITGHGHYDEDKKKYFLVIENPLKIGLVYKLYEEEFKNIFEKNLPTLPTLIVLSTCHAENFGKILVDLKVPHVICTSTDKISVENANNFAKIFCENLFTGETIQKSFDRAKSSEFKLLPKDYSHDISLFPKYSDKHLYNDCTQSPSGNVIENEVSTTTIIKNKDDINNNNQLMTNVTQQTIAKANCSDENDVPMSSSELSAEPNIQVTSTPLLLHDYSNDQESKSNYIETPSHLIDIPPSCKGCIKRTLDTFELIQQLDCSSCVNFNGEKGSGKTEITKMVLKYISRRQHYKDGIIYIDIREILLKYYDQVHENKQYRDLFTNCHIDLFEKMLLECVWEKLVNFRHNNTFNAINITSEKLCKELENAKMFVTIDNIPSNVEELYHLFHESEIINNYGLINFNQINNTNDEKENKIHWLLENILLTLYKNILNLMAKTCSLKMLLISNDYLFDTEKLQKIYGSSTKQHTLQPLKFEEANEYIHQYVPSIDNTESLIIYEYCNRNIKQIFLFNRWHKQDFLEFKRKYGKLGRFDVQEVDDEEQ